MSNSLKYYHRRRKALLRQILGISEDEPIYCECGCEAEGYDDYEWHVDHVGEEKNGTKEGGWQHLYQLEEELREGIDLEVVTRTCHEERDGKIFDETKRMEAEI